MNFYYCVKDESFKLSEGNDTFPARKQRLSALAEEKKEINIVVGKQDFAAFQLLLGSDEAYTVNTGAAPYLSQYPDKDNFRVALELPFEAETFIEYSAAEPNGVCHNDMLSPLDARDYEGNRIAAIFVNIPIPKNTAAADYFGKVKIYGQRLVEDEKLLGEISVKITVKDCILPAAGKGKFYLDLWQHSTNIAHHADVKLYSDEHFAVIKEYLSSLAKLGQRALTIVVSEAPWAGQSCYDVEKRGNLFEYSIIPIIKKKNGIFEYDFSKMQRYIDIGKSLGIKSEISLYGLVNVWGEIIGKPAQEYPESIRVRYFDEESSSYRYMREVGEIDSYIKAIEDYFIKTNQIDIVRIAADEPTNIEAFSKSIYHIHDIAPTFKFKAAIVHPEFIKEFSEIFNDFVPALEALTDKIDEISSYMKTMPEKRYLWYVCCGPEHPNMFVRSPLSESYLIGILTSYFRLNGFLRWDYTVWTEDPRSNLNFRPNWAAGDMNYVYPGYNGKPLLSLRYFALRRGIQFYELLETYRSRKGVRAYNSLIGEIIRPNEGSKAKVYSFDEYVMPSEEEFSKLYEKLLTDLSK